MNVFVPYNEPIKVAQCLDTRRLNKQIIECEQILKAIRGASQAWKNHPATLMYSKHTDYLKHYCETLRQFKNATNAEKENSLALKCIPPFLTNDFCDQHKRRLFTKDNAHYKQFNKLGESEQNWYIVDNEL